MSLLAGQTVEKALTVDGSKQMLRELDCFFGSDNIRSPIDSCLVPSSVEVRVGQFFDTLFLKRILNNADDDLFSQFCNIKKTTTTIYLKKTTT